MIKNLKILLTLASLLPLFGVAQTLKADGAKKFDAGMRPILTEYLKIHESLMASKFDEIKKSSEKIIKLSEKLDPSSVSGEHSGHYKHVPMNLKKHATSLASAKDITTAREAFKKLSQPMAMWTGMAKPNGFSVMYCPMVKASWVQKDGKTKNPYDNKMPHCGSKV